MVQGVKYFLEDSSCKLTVLTESIVIDRIAKVWSGL